MLPVLNRYVAIIVFISIFQLLAIPDCMASGNRQHRSEYVMGVFPFIPTSSIEAIFAPVAAELGAATGKPVKLRTTTSFEKFMGEIRERIYDIAFIQPLDYPDVAKPAGYLPLAARNDQLTSNIVVRPDSRILTLKELKGRKLGMPPKVSAVSFMNGLALRKAGLVPDTDVKMVYLASHQACLQQLLIGMVDACGVSAPGVRLVEQQMKIQFRLIHETPPIPSPLFVVKKELPEKQRELLRKALLESDLKGVRPQLRSMFIGDARKPFRKVSEQDYDAINKARKIPGTR